jgi:G3E family GTPase
MSPIPITVFTGFLGAGKTTTILALLKNLPKDYKAVLLKNEFGDVEVDSKLIQQSSLAAVSEILNGCMSVYPDLKVAPFADFILGVVFSLGRCRMLC